MDDPPEQDIEPEDSVPEPWLTRFEQTAEAKALARITADVELLTELALNRFEGPAYRRFAELLARYGIAVINAWCRKGEIFYRCAEKGYGLSPRALSQEEALDLTVDTVADALRSYRDNILLRGRWDPTRGATLKMYFIGHCLLIFPNHYRRERTQQQRRHRFSYVDDPEAAFDRATSADGDPERIHLDLAAYQGALARLDPGLRAIADYRAQGYQIDEIAELIGLPASTIHSRIYRFRQKERSA